MHDDDEDEVWRPVPGHSGYRVSTEGRVRCSRPIGRPKAGKARVGALERDVKPTVGPTGYLTVGLGKVPGTTRHVRRHVHDLVLSAFHRSKREGEEADHLNGDKADNRLVNLEWVSHRENLRRYWEGVRSCA